MSTDVVTIDEPEVRAAVAAVADPELPPVTIGMLGMVHDVAIVDGVVSVELLPTFSGCPATDMIERDVVHAVAAVDGVEQVRVRFRFDPPWTPDRIDALGRERLREFGITPPGGPVHGAVRAEGRPTLPLAVTPGVQDADGTTDVDGDQAGKPCPYCGSTETTKDSDFGPTPCRDIRHCTACDQPFEAFKSL